MADFPEFEEVGAPSRSPGGLLSPTGGVRVEPSLRAGDPFPEFEEVQAPSADVGGAVSAVSKRAVGAFAQTAPIIPGVVMGAKLGALVPPPFTGPAMAAGATIGLTSALLFGNSAAELLEDADLAVSDIKHLPPGERPFGAAGEVLGGSAPFLGAPLMAARLGLRLPTSFAGDFLNSIITSAERSPVAFAALEASSTTSAALASGITEAVAPDRPLLRAAAEVSAGLFSPTRIAATLTEKVARPITAFVKTLTPGGRMTQAAKFLQEAVETAGEDPASIMAILREADVPGVGGPQLSAAQKSGSRALAEFEADIRAINQKFGADVARQSSDALEATSRAIALLRGTGDPGALRVAAEMRKDQFKTMLQTRLDAGIREVADKAAQISTDTPATRAALSREAEGILDDVLKRSRKVESELWQAVPNLPLQATGADRTLARWSKLRGEMLERATLDPVLTGTVADLRAAKEVMTKAAHGEAVDAAELAKAQARFSVDHLRKVRSESLDLARQADKAGRRNDARIYGEMAESVLDDLAEAGVSGPGTPLEEARTFSRELNDVFTRTFVGKAEAVGKFGGEVIPPELLLRRALATGEELGALQMRQIEEATRFLADRGRGTPIDSTSFNTIMQAQERIIRLAAAQAVTRDPATGVIQNVSPDKLRAFMTRNEEILQRFPETQRVLQEAVETEVGHRILEAQVKRASTYADKKAIVSKLLDVENPSDAVRGALHSRNPIGQIGAMARLAKQGGPDAVDGLRAALWEDAFRSATMPGGQTSMSHLVSALDDPIRPGNPSLVRLMRQQGLLTAPEGELVQGMVERIRKIELARTARPTGSPPVEQTDAIIDTMIRVVGSRAGSSVAGGRTGPQLIAAKRGSEAARAFFEKIPGLKVQNLLIAALRGDPISPGAARYTLLETLLERPTSPARAEDALRQVHAYGVQAGMLATGGYQVEGEQP
jgi:hypothetical protein